jgi:hypothetical protein
MSYRAALNNLRNRYTTYADRLDDIEQLTSPVEHLRLAHDAITTATEIYEAFTELEEHAAPITAAYRRGPGRSALEILDTARDLADYMDPLTDKTQPPDRREEARESGNWYDDPPEVRP